eukprot:764421-Hanusia_phi.AAC.3
MATTGQVASQGRGQSAGHRLGSAAGQVSSLVLQEPSLGVEGCLAKVRVLVVVHRHHDPGTRQLSPGPDLLRTSVASSSTPPALTEEYACAARMPSSTCRRQ